MEPEGNVDLHMEKVEAFNTLLVGFQLAPPMGAVSKPPFPCLPNTDVHEHYKILS